MKYMILLAIILVAGCVTETETVSQDGSPVDKSGTITTASFENCLAQCDQGGPGSGPGCKDGCRFEQAENTKDLAYCEQLDQEESKPECYGTVAIAAGDMTICDKLQSQEDRNHCVATFGPR